MLKDVLLITHFIGLALGLGTGFAMMRLGASTKDMDAGERAKLMNRAMVLSKNGSMGLGLLLLSGLAMLWLGGGMALLRAAGWPFHVKLTLVVIAMGLVGAMQSAQARLRRSVTAAETQAVAAKLPRLGMATTFTTLLIVVMAVLAFH
jgi:hypothetical protein